jgi:uncharacterized protein with HEPN domain
MQDAAGDIATFAAGRTFEQYLGNKQFRMAVERAFEIVGEALSPLRNLDPMTAERTTDWKAVKAFATC